jgi:hypothetical protein
VVDAVEIEKRGKPTLTISLDLFANAAKMHAEILGMPDIPLFIECAPKGGRVTREITALTEEDINRIVASLTAKEV